MGVEADGAQLRKQLDEAKARLKQLRGQSQSVRVERRNLTATIEGLEQVLADMAFDDREMDRIESAAAAMKRSASLSPQERRIRDLLARDRADEAAENYRREAEIEVDAGRTVYMADAVVPPTPEQLATGEFEPYTPRQPDGSVREVTTHRRRGLPQVQRLVLAGVIDGTGLRHCLWYRNIFDQSGLAGNVGSVDFGREVFVSPQARAMFSDRQVEMQDTLRFVRGMLEARRCALLDQVVIADVAFTLAYRRLGFRTRAHRREGIARAHRLFAEIVDDLGAARKAADRAN